MILRHVLTRTYLSYFRLVKKQLAYILARQQLSLETEDESLTEILNNTRLSEHFRALGKDLDILEPKIPEDVYKSHLENVRPGMTATVDSAKQNLAATFVNAFLNAGFGTDKLMMGAGSEEGSWIFKNKDHGSSMLLIDRNDECGCFTWIYFAMGC